MFFDDLEWMAFDLDSLLEEDLDSFPFDFEDPLWFLCLIEETETLDFKRGFESGIDREDLEAMFVDECEWNM